jgi:hypothetical protein
MREEYRSRTPGNGSSKPFLSWARVWGTGAILAALAFLYLLRPLGARIGPFVAPETASSWLVLAAVAAFFLAPSSSRPFRPARQLVSAAALAIALAALVARMEALHESLPRLPLSLSRLSDEGAGPERSLSVSFPRLTERKYLHRLIGRRRDAVLSLQGWFSPLATGLHRFHLDCDDRCSLSIDGRAVPEDGSPLFLERGAHSLELRYEQGGGPARLAIDWRGPGAFAPLGLEHYVALDPQEVSLAALERKGREATVLLALGLLGCALGSAWVVSAGGARGEWRALLSSRRLAKPLAATTAGLLIAYGAVLRVDALLVRSHGVRESATAERIHQRLRPYLPDYDAFDPANYEESPYRADAKSYLDRALELGWNNFYEPHVREPLHPALVRAFVELSKDRVGVLLESVFFSIAVLPLFFLAARQWVGNWLAVALLVPLALNEALVREAPSGYRESAYSFFLVAFVAWVFAPARNSERRAVVAGVLAGALCLIRLSGLSFVLPLLGLSCWERRREGGRKYAAIAAAVLLLSLGPYLFESYRVKGDPFYSVSIHTHYWMEHEGRSDPPRGVSFTRYFFEFHDPAELVLGHVLGLTSLPLRTFWKGLSRFPLLDTAVVALGIAGLVLAFFGEPRFPLVAYLGHLIPFAYIQNFPSGEDPRFVIPAYFFLVIAAGFALRHAGGNGPPESPPPPG